MAYFNTNFSYHRQTLKWPIYTPRWNQGFSACFCSFCCVGYAVVWPSSAHLLSSGATSSERLLDYNRMVSLVCHIYVQYLFSIFVVMTLLLIVLRLQDTALAQVARNCKYWSKTNNPDTAAKMSHCVTFNFWRQFCI